MRVQTVRKSPHQTGAGAGTSVSRCFVQKLGRPPDAVVFNLDDKPVASRSFAANADDARLVVRMGVFDRINKRLAGDRADGNGLLGRNQSVGFEEKQRVYAFSARERAARRIGDFTQIR